MTRHSEPEGGSAEALAAAVRRGEPRAVARAITVVSRGGARAGKLLDTLGPQETGWRIAVTGPPGAGKSTLVSRVTADLRAAGETVGILAVDAASPFTGGAVLGDRIRMREVEGDPGVFIRSMAGDGRPGGMAVAALDAARVLSASGTDWVIVETVGTGQSETDAIAIGDTVVLVLVPEAGDAVQALKAGVLEAADVLVMNKGDRPLAGDLTAALREETAAREKAWRPRVVTTTATTGAGVEELIEALREHRRHFSGASAGDLRRHRRFAAECVLRARAVLSEALSAASDELIGTEADEGFRSMDPRAVARRLAARAGEEALRQEGGAGVLRRPGEP